MLRFAAGRADKNLRGFHFLLYGWQFLVFLKFRGQLHDLLEQLVDQHQPMVSVRAVF